MKILHLIYSQQVAGAEKYLLDLLPALKIKGVDSSLVCVIPEADQYKFTDFAKALNERGITVKIIPGSSYNLIGAAKEISRYAKQNGFHIIHAHLFKADIVAVLIKKLFNRKIKLLSTKHGYQEKYLNNYNRYKGKIVYDAYYFISKWVNAGIDEQVTISKAMSDMYYDLKLTKTRIPYIHHGVDIPDTLRAEKKQLSSPQLVIVGRIERMKGHEYLFKAMPDIVKKYPSVQLLVLGNGSEKENLEKIAAALHVSANIQFLGFQPNPYAYVTGSDIVILPSLFEPFGLVYIEAFALKTPVVAFDVQATNEIIQQNETGILVPVFDYARLAENIIKLLGSSEERERLSNNAFNRYTTHFTKERMVTETMAWYQLVCKG